MLQNPCKTLGFKKNMDYAIPPGGGGGEGKLYPASGLTTMELVLKNFSLPVSFVCVYRIVFYHFICPRQLISFLYTFSEISKIYKITSIFSSFFSIKVVPGSSAYVQKVTIF